MFKVSQIKMFQLYKYSKGFILGFLCEFMWSIWIINIHFLSPSFMSRWVINPSPISHGFVVLTTPPPLLCSRDRVQAVLLQAVGRRHVGVFGVRLQPEESGRGAARHLQPQRGGVGRRSVTVQPAGPVDLWGGGGGVWAGWERGHQRGQSPDVITVSY